MTQPSVLIVDDDQRFREYLVEELAREQLDARSADSVASAIAQLDQMSFDVVLTDLNMPQATGLDLCRHVLERTPETPVILLTAFGSLDTAMQAVRLGAFDYITKPFSTEELLLRIERATKSRRLREELKRLQEWQQQDDPMVKRMQGECAPIRNMRSMIEKLAPLDVGVLISGESGSGKELVARELHEKSGRRRGPFIAINCAALPESLIESELFGAERGAFTDARTSRQGLFTQANGGTLFLDEIGELPLAVQPKLLRALQEQTYRPIGGTHELKSDARIVAASNRDLESAAEEGRFRKDLFYRLNIVSLHVPPLRARGTDILILARGFLDEARKRFGLNVSKISPQAAQRLLDYEWPGNVRELKNCIESAVALARREQIEVEDLTAAVRNYERKGSFVLPAGDPGAIVELAEIEKRYIVQAYDAFAKNKSLTAKALGLDRKTLRSKLRSYGITDED